MTGVVTTLELEVFTTAKCKALINSLQVEELQLSHVHAHASPFRNSIQPLLVILKDDGVDVKAKPVLPHMDASLDHHAHSSSYKTQLSESVYVSAISSLSACQQPTGRAEMHCSPGHSLCITFPSAPPWLDVVSSFLLFLPDWAKSLPGYSRVGWKPLTLSLSLRAGPLVWTYHLLVLYS